MTDKDQENLFDFKKVGDIEVAQVPPPPPPENIDEWTKRAARAHRQEIEALVPLVLELARRAGSAGITVDNVLTTAAQRGLMPLLGKGRQHSFLGALCRTAGLVPTGQRVRSGIPGKNGNLRQVWVIPSKGAP